MITDIKQNDINIQVVVVLVNYNNIEDTVNCISSLECSEIPTYTVIVDNNSPIKGIEKSTSQFNNVHLIQLKENVGFGKGNNVGIEWALNHTNCDYIFILNNDTEIKKDCIKLLQKEIESDKNIGMATCKILMMHEPEKIWYGGGEFNEKTGKVEALYGKPVTYDNANKNRFVSFASGCAMFFKRETLERIKGFDSRFFMYIEDVEISLRILKENLKILYVHNAIIFHKCQGSLRGKEETFVPRLNVKNKKLPFYVYHTFKNQFITSHIYIQGINKLYFFMSFYSYWSAKFIQLLLNNKINACKAILKAQKDALTEIKL